MSIVKFLMVMKGLNLSMMGAKRASDVARPSSALTSVCGEVNNSMPDAVLVSIPVDLSSPKIEFLISLACTASELSVENSPASAKSRTGPAFALPRRKRV